jgi:hypothetical protein
MLLRRSLGQHLIHEFHISLCKSVLNIAYHLLESLESVAKNLSLATYVVTSLIGMILDLLKSRILLGFSFKHGVSLNLKVTVLHLTVIL